MPHPVTGWKTGGFVLEYKADGRAPLGTARRTLKERKFLPCVLMNAFSSMSRCIPPRTPASSTHPTTKRQFDLANQLVEELKALGLADAHVDEHCYVYATIPATPGCEQAHSIGFIAHMDTTEDAPGENVKPILHENYDGGDVYLPGSGATIPVAEFPFLADLKGQTLITTDGTTLLGADDKAGVAEIVTMAERLIAEKAAPRQDLHRLHPR